MSDNCLLTVWIQAFRSLIIFQSLITDYTTKVRIFREHVLIALTESLQLFRDDDWFA